MNKSYTDVCYASQEGQPVAVSRRAVAVISCGSKAGARNGARALATMAVFAAAWLAGPAWGTTEVSGDANIINNPNGASADGGAGGCNTFLFNRENPGNNNGSDSNDYFDPPDSQLCSTAVGDGATAQKGGVAVGDRATSLDSGVAVGAGASALGNSATAIGPVARAEGNTAVAIGRQSAGEGDYSVAVGNVAWSEGDSSVAIGHSAHATGYRSIAIGSADSQNAGSDGVSPGALYDAATQTLATGEGAVALGAGAQANNDNDVALGAGSVTAAQNTGTFTIDGSTAAGLNNGAAVVSVGSDGAERQIQNVAPGVLSSNSTDAVNGSQLYATNQQVNTNTTNITNNTTNINQLQNDALLWDPAADGGNGAFNAIHGGTGPNKIVNVADGTNANDAVNFSQLQAVSQQAGLGWKVSINDGPAQTVSPGETVGVDQGSNIVLTQSGNDLTIATSDNPNFTTVTTTGNVDVGGDLNVDGMLNANGGLTVAAGQTVDVGGNKILNVADGDVSAGSSDAVNGSQLYDVKQMVQASGSFELTVDGDTANASTIGPADTVDLTNTDGNIVLTKSDNSTTDTTTATFNLADDINVNSVTADNGTDRTVYNAEGMTIQDGPSVTTSGIDAGNDRITNVAPGVAPDDAVNVHQLNSSLDELGERMEAGVASAIAIASLPQAYQPNQSAVAVALGQYEGETGFAVGLSSVTDSGSYVFGLNVTGNSEGDFGAGVGAAFMW